MSIEEIIKSLDSHANMFENMRRHQAPSDGVFFADILREAIALLHTHPEAQPDEPLTMEELREMVDQPVWVKAPGVSNDISGRWVIVEGVNLDERTIYTRGDFSCHDYGAVWLAYRRPPKEG